MAPLLWLIPLFPLLAAGAIAVMPRSRARLAAALAVGALLASGLIATLAWLETLFPEPGQGVVRLYHNFTWFEAGDFPIQLGWLLDPLSGAMVLMVTFVGSLIFLFSIGYMAEDPNAARFFGFLSLFAAAMLGLLVANSLLLLFMCWEVVGLASYLLIGFWYHKPEAAAAARKAFITTRIGDIGFLLGMVWLQASAGTLVFYDSGRGCLEAATLARLVAETTAAGMAVSTAISLLILCGAVGKSGQVPLHVWLPDAMEGPTPVSALIHAATMVAAGVFLVARLHPLFAAGGAGGPDHPGGVSTALVAVTWIGAITAIFGALIAVAQTDIKRILAYSTVSQLGYMFLGVGTGGPAVGMFHLLTHAFFKALLFLGAGSVIHGCHHEQDIRRMGGLRQTMPVTFVTYAIGMMALAGVPVVFSGFWSKDAILHHAMHWPVSRLPFVLGLTGAFLTAFYMTRQMAYVFLAPPAGGPASAGEAAHGHAHGPDAPHESPSIMLLPLRVLAGAVLVLTLVATPFWPAFEAYLAGHLDRLHLGWEGGGGAVAVLVLSMVAVGLGIYAGWALYQDVHQIIAREGRDPLESRWPGLYRRLQARLHVDEFYEATVFRLHDLGARTADTVDRVLLGGAVLAVSVGTQVLAWLSRAVDEVMINFGFDAACESLRSLGAWSRRLQGGRIQRYLGISGAAVILLLVLMAWVGGKS